MLNPIEKALEEIRDEIPFELLQAAYLLAGDEYGGTVYSLDHRIRTTTIERRVLTDMDLVGGSEVYLPLAGAGMTQVDAFTYIYNIPMSVTQNRPITQVYSVHFGPLGYASPAALGMGSQSVLGAATSKVLDAAIKSPPAETSYINILNANTIQVRFTYRPTSMGFLRCKLGMDEGMTNLRPALYLDFAEMCMLAVQAHIYTKLAVKVDKDALAGGQSLGVFREILWKFEGASEAYKAARKRWRKMAVYNDPEQYRRLLRSMIIN